MIHAAYKLSNHFSFNFMTDFAVLRLDVLKSTQIFHNSFVFWNMFREPYTTSTWVC